jgi:hypothetical protein
MIETRTIRTCVGYEDYLLWEGCLLRKEEIYDLPRFLRLRLERETREGSACMGCARAIIAGSAGDRR